MRLFLNYGLLSKTGFGAVAPIELSFQLRSLFFSLANRFFSYLIAKIRKEMARKDNV